MMSALYRASWGFGTDGSDHQLRFTLLNMLRMDPSEGYRITDGS